LTTGFFEVIQTTAENAGPRTPGAPVVNAGTDGSVEPQVPLGLTGAVIYTNAFPLATRWSLYAGPTNVIFADPTKTNTTATFSAPGVYTLMLSASNGVHTTAFDAVIVNVQNTIRLNINRTDTNVSLRWQGGTPPFTVERTSTIPSTSW